MKTAGSLPVNVKFLIEGEEEVGSNNLDIFLEKNKAKLAADVALISDAGTLGAADIALREILEEKIGWDLPEMTELVRPKAKKRRKH